MSITTYDELKTAVSDWLHRDDLATKVADFITLAEADLHDRLLLRTMETEATLTATVNSAVVSLPTGYVSPKALWIVEDSERSLIDPSTPEELPYYSGSGRPQYWAIDGAYIRFDCPCDVAYSLPFRYIKTQSLSDTNTSNQLLAKRPDVYLHGALVQAAIYAEDDTLLSKHTQLYEKAVQGLSNAESRNKMAPLRTDFGMHARSNILRG